MFFIYFQQNGILDEIPNLATLAVFCVFGRYCSQLPDVNIQSGVVVFHFYGIFHFFFICSLYYSYSTPCLRKK